MNASSSLTVLFTTFNEEDNIAAALDSVVGWAAEIIVVDSFSTDNTEGVVKRYENVQFLQHIYFGPAFQKNWAIPLANHEWVLIMDADERVTPSMRFEIDEILSRQSVMKQQASRGVEIGNDFFDCFWIGFTHYFMGKKVRYSGWQNDKTVRLIKREKCRYNQNRVHEEIRTEGLRVGKLENKFEHYTFKNIKHFVDKQMRYAAWSAEDKDVSTGRITYFHLVLKPFMRFIKHFIIKKGFLDGHVGFVISAVAAWSVFMRYIFMLENRRQSKRIL